MFAFNVYLNRKLIDTVFYTVDKSETISEACLAIASAIGADVSEYLFV